MVSLTNCFDAYVGSHSIQTEQQAYLKGLLIQDFAYSGTAKVFGEADTQSRFFQDIEQRRCSPALPDFSLEFPKILWFCLALEGREMKSSHLFSGGGVPCH